MGAPLLLLLVATETASAQPVQPVRLTDIEGYLEFGVLHEREERSRQQKDTSWTFDRLDFSELLHLDVRGYAYHPRFLTFQVGGEFEAIQAAMEGEDREPVGGYWRFNFLPEHPYGLALFGRVLESETDRRFARTYAVQNEEYGTTFSYRTGWAPFDLTYRHRSRKGTEISSQFDEVGDDVELHVRYRLGENSSGRLLYDWTSETRHDRDIDRQELFFTNVTYFSNKRKRLRGNLRLWDESDIFQTYIASGLLDFNWDHTDSFSTRYHLDVYASDRESQSLVKWHPRIGLRHRLFESLTTEAEIYADIQDASFGDSREYGARLGEDYSKRLGDWGRLDIGIHPHVRLMQRRPKESTARVFDERYRVETGAAGREIRLEQLEIVPGTITVTDPDDTSCTEGAFPPCSDFDTRQIGDVTWLIPGPGLEGRTILVDYEYNLPLDADLLFTSVNLRASLRLFDHWFLYTRFDFDDQELRSGNPDLRLESRDRQVAGVELFWPWIDARVEFENEDTTLGSSYWAISESLSLFSYGSASWSARVSGSHRFLQFTDSDEQLSQITLVARANARVTSRGLLELEADYRRERWSGGIISDANDLDGVGAKLGFTWWYRTIEVTLEGELWKLMRPREEETETRLELRVRRYF